MAETSKIIIGLPNLPDNNLDSKLYGELLTVYRAIQNLLAGVSQYTGIDPPDPAIVGQIDPTSYLSGANAAQWYPLNISGGVITRGQLVRLAGSNSVALANASSASGLAIGVADETKASGQRLRVIVGGGGALTTAIGGMSAGALYYVSPTPGAIQNLPPIAAGQVVQHAGWALTSNVLLINCNSFYRQL